MTLPRLSRDTLARLERRPEFDAARITTGIVHLGIGAFARAHLARYTQPLLAADPGWGILGVSLRSAATRSRRKTGSISAPTATAMASD